MNEPKRRGRPPKARVEGGISRSNIANVNRTVRSVMVDLAEGELAAMDSNRLAAIVAMFKTEHEAEWESMRLCPLENGLEAMIGLLK